MLNIAQHIVSYSIHYLLRVKQTVAFCLCNQLVAIAKIVKLSKLIFSLGPHNYSTSLQLSFTQPSHLTLTTLLQLIINFHQQSKLLMSIMLLWHGGFNFLLLIKFISSIDSMSQELTRALNNTNPTTIVKLPPILGNLAYSLALLLGNHLCWYRFICIPL